MLQAHFGFHQLGGSIKFIAALEALPLHVLVASHDGRLHALHSDDGETAWSLLYSFGIESNQPFHWLEQDGNIWLHHVEAERLLKIEVVSGKITGMLALAKESTWTIHANVLYLARNGQLEAIP
ncbi:MAG: hypothetical protein HQ519_12065 [Planctomycetes bacterium]|nr:hypothetical protein [Planctomycetota bacterium]